MSVIDMIKTIGTALVVLHLVRAAPTNGSPKIVNGTDASINDYPFMVSLRSASGSHSCGGSILNQQWILTAAHCVDYYTTVYYQSVQVGKTNISRDVDDSVYLIDHAVVHPYYDSENSYFFDIALLKLEKPLIFSDTVQPVTLPNKWSEVCETDLGVTLIGWGRNASEGVVQSTLQAVDYYVVPNDECSRIHSNHIYPSQICAAFPGGGKGQCSGDSGGPLLHNGIQVGIVSWSIKPCTVAPFPGVLTKVSYFLDFINETIADVV